MEQHAAAVSSYNAALAESVLALRGSDCVQTSRELGRIRLGGLPGMDDAPTVEIHKHLTASVLCHRSACWRRLGNAWRALADAEAATETFVEWGTCHARMGEALEAAGDAAAALRSYRRAAAFSPGVPAFAARLDDLLAQLLGGGGAVPLANPEARWVAQGGGASMLWAQLRAASCVLSVGMGDELWRLPEAALPQPQGGPPATAAEAVRCDCGPFFAEQQRLLEVALGVVAGNTGLATTELVLEAGIERLPPVRRCLTAHALACILSWLGDFESAAGFSDRALAALAEAQRSGSSGVALWGSLLHCNRSVARLRAGDVAGARADAEAAARLCPAAPRPHARLGDAAASGGDWAAASAHFADALSRCEPGSAAAVDAGSRLALASRGGRGGGGGIGGTPPRRTPAASPAGSPLLRPSDPGHSVGRSLSSASLLDALSLGGKRRGEAAQLEEPPPATAAGRSPSKSPKRSRPTTPEGERGGEEGVDAAFQARLAAALAASAEAARAATPSPPPPPPPPLAADVADYAHIFGDGGAGELHAAVYAFGEARMPSGDISDYLLAAFQEVVAGSALEGT